MSSDTPVWFVTGCSTGFGRQIVHAVLARGWRVVATARNPASLVEFTTNPKVLVAALDVTIPAQITAVVAQAEATFGRIDVLVNNAGYGYLSAVEEGEDDEIRAMFETNFFGLANVTTAVLPSMRARRHGFVVNISSVGGLVGFPGIGFYNATKFAVEGVSEALAKEVGPLGIKVIIVEPGPFRTDWAGRSLKHRKMPSSTMPKRPAPAAMPSAPTAATNPVILPEPPRPSSRRSTRRTRRCIWYSDIRPMTLSPPNWRSSRRSWKGGRTFPWGLIFRKNRDALTALPKMEIPCDILRRSPPPQQIVTKWRRLCHRCGTGARYNRVEFW